MRKLISNWLLGCHQDDTSELGASSASEVSVFAQSDTGKKVAIAIRIDSAYGAHALGSWCLGSGLHLILSEAQMQYAPILAATTAMRCYPFALVVLTTSVEGSISQNPGSAISDEYMIPADMQVTVEGSIQNCIAKLSSRCNLGIPEGGARPQVAVVRGVVKDGNIHCVVGIDLYGRLGYAICNSDADGLDGVVRSAAHQFLRLCPGTKITAMLTPGDTAIEGALFRAGFSLPYTATPTTEHMESGEGGSLFYVINMVELWPPPQRLADEAEPDNISLQDIYLLIGQSNMAGRGALGDIYSDKTKQFVREMVPEFEWGDQHSPGDYYGYDPKHGWLKNSTDLHRNVDILKNTGVGPGNSFAKEMSKELNNGDSLNDTLRHVGLVPAAVGATSLEEWMPEYYAKDQLGPDSKISWPCFDKETREILPPPNACYSPHNVNILGCALRSVYLSVLALSPDESTRAGSAIGGILWYQGCNDAADSEHVAQTLYPKRFPRFMSFVREAVQVIVQAAVLRCRPSDAPLCAYCDKDRLAASADRIPVVTVAITSTRPMLTHIKTIRRYQLNQAQLDVPNLAVVDAQGAALSKDSIHLECKSYVLLGYLLKKQMVALKKQISSTVGLYTGTTTRGLDEISSTLIDMNKNLPVTRHPLCREVDETTEGIFTSALTMAHEDLTSNKGYLKHNVVASSVFRAENEPAGSDANSKELFPILKSKLKSVNFVYGELSYQGMCRVLAEYVRCSHDKNQLKKAPSGLCFVDLGSGAGVSIAAAVLSGLFSTVVGIELMRTKVNICRSMIDYLRVMMRDRIFIDCKSSGESVVAPTSDAEKKPKLSCKVDIIEEDFLIVPWWTVADVVYAACTCFSEDLLGNIIDKCFLLKRGAIVILLDRPVLADRSSEFELLGSFEATASWGDTFVFVYIKM